MSLRASPTGNTRAQFRTDRLIVRLGGTRWSTPEVFESIGSTNTHALERPTPGRILVADHQSSGRGRLARPWTAPPRASLAVSAVLPLPADQRLWGWVPLLSAVAIRQVLAARGPQVTLKWPNDVLARAEDDQPWRKLVGILCHSAHLGQEPVVVIGLGTNTDLRQEELPVETATSLRLLGVQVEDREDLVADLLAALAGIEQRWLEGGFSVATMQNEYRRHCVTLGQDVRVQVPRGDRTGRAVAVDDDGRLVVRTATGDEALAVGDVVHVRPEAAS